MTLVAALVTLLAQTLGLLVHLRTRLHVPTRAPASGNVLDVHWRSSDLAPAAAPGQICLAAPTAGRVCAAFAAGQRPADALSTALKARGVSVRSS